MIHSLAKPNRRAVVAPALFALVAGCGGGSQDAFVNVTWQATCAMLGGPACLQPAAVHVVIGANGDVDPMDRTLEVSCSDTETAAGTIILDFAIEPGDGSTLSAPAIYVDPDNGAVLDDFQLIFDEAGVRYTATAGMQAPADGICQVAAFVRDGHDYTTTIECGSITGTGGYVRSFNNPLGGAFTLQLTNCR